MLYKSLNWILLKPATDKIDPSGPVEYVTQRSVVQSFAPVYKAPKVRLKRRPHTPLDRLPSSIITRARLFHPRDSVYAVQGTEERSCLYGKPIPHTKKPPKTLTQIQRDWEDSKERYQMWKTKNGPPCSPINEIKEVDETAKVEEVANDSYPSKFDGVETAMGSKEDPEDTAGCVFKLKSSEDKLKALGSIQPAPLKFGNLVDAHSRFPEESATSEDSEAEPVVEKTSLAESKQRKGPPQPHQRKFRRLRRATRKLIGWIESLKPKQELKYHWIVKPNGQKVNSPMHPYIPQPEDEQPFPLVDAEEVIDMVRNAYGSRPALSLKVAVHDVDDLPEELEKFDNFYYLKKRLINHQVYKKTTTTRDDQFNVHPRPANRYSFRMVAAIKERNVPAIGTTYDTITGRRCRYGAWYLRRSLWRKMDASEEIQKRGVHTSEEAFQRITGTKRLYAVDSQVNSKVNAYDTQICELYSAKEFHRILNENNRPIPAWLNGCDESEQVQKPQRRSLAFESDVWRAGRREKDEKLAICKPKVIGNSLNGSGEDGDLPKIDPALYDFLYSLENYKG